jgi:hypothetical protein
VIQCETCKFAEWKRTANGRLHPDKSGKCTRLIAHPLDFRVPAAFYWHSVPNPLGGYIQRGEKDRSKCIFKAGMP